MNKILIVTHSTLAEGFFNSTKFLSGMTDNLTFINAYVDQSDWTKKARQFLKQNCKPDNYVVVLTDIYGGSVNQKMTLMLNDYNFTLITGINLALVLSLALEPNKLTTERCQQLAQEASGALKIVERPKKTSKNIDDDDFLS